MRLRITFLLLSMLLAAPTAWAGVLGIPPSCTPVTVIGVAEPFPTLGILAVRTGPGVRYPIQGDTPDPLGLMEGRVVDACGSVGPWVHVYWPSDRDPQSMEEGWAHGRYLVPVAVN